MKTIIKDLTRIRSHIKSQRQLKSLCPILYTNGWNNDFTSPRWWTDFVNLATENAYTNSFKLEITSVFGPRWLHRFPSNLPKIFFSPEDTEFRYRAYNDYLEREADLALGFKYEVAHTNYERFPLWLLYFLSSDCALNSKREAEVARFLNRLEGREKENLLERPFFCSLVASHDERGNGAGLRTQVGDVLAPLGDIQYAGRFRNNNNILQVNFDDDINAFLAHCSFNICLENTNSPGYTTEKLFQALLQGAIPIYWGSGNHPEPEVLTGNGIVFHDPTRPQATFEQVKRLTSDKTYREDFLNKPIVKPTAQAFIEERISIVRNKILALI